jgi:rhodanese-related sulfurtransferase
MKHMTITPKELHQMMQQSPLLLIDVREPDEWQDHHIEGATLIPLATIPNQIDKVCQDRSQPVYLYCQHGRRSHKAALMLLSLGFNHIIELEGGVSHWIDAGLPCQTC